MTAGRRLASRAIAWQAGATTLAALAFLAQSAAAALAALVGGGAVVAGTLAAAWLSYRGGVQPANVILVRWFAGVMVRWVVVLLALLLGFAVWRLPSLALLAGVAIALAAQGLGALRR
jgi:ATP synthase protein I